jgi:Cof subfamily protein (haloacid dehalogenase superfamily)
MDLSKIKLVVSDMDGTLLNSEGNVSKDFFQLFQKLKEKEIYFVAASGRQFHSIKNKLSPIQDDIYVIAENGGITLKGSEVFGTNTLSIEIVGEIIKTIREIENTEIIVCGRKKAYIESENEEFISYFQNFYLEFEQVEDLLKVTQDEVFKIAVYHPQDSEKHIFPQAKFLEDKLQVKISGKHWLDISSLETHKGNALGKLQQKLGINRSQTVVFGDYNNDLEMLQLSDFSFAMENAHPNVKKTAKYGTKSNDEYGVEAILEKILNL